MKYKTKDIGAALIKKGFQVRQSKHTIYILYVNQKKTRIFTFISHGISEYGDIPLSKMKKQLYLSREEFENLIECPLSEEKLVEIYSNKGLI